jgi:hypothetical protein
MLGMVRIDGFLSLSNLVTLNPEQVEALLIGFGAAERFRATTTTEEPREDVKRAQIALTRPEVTQMLPTADQVIEKIITIVRSLEMRILEEVPAVEPVGLLQTLKAMPDTERIAERLTVMEETDDALSLLYALRVLGQGDHVNRGAQITWRIGRKITQGLNTISLHKFQQVLELQALERNLEVDQVGRFMWVTTLEPDRAAEMLSAVHA